VSRQATPLPFFVPTQNKKKGVCWARVVVAARLSSHALAGKQPKGTGQSLSRAQHTRIHLYARPNRTFLHASKNFLICRLLPWRLNGLRDTAVAAKNRYHSSQPPGYSDTEREIPPLRGICGCFPIVDVSRPTDCHESIPQEDKTIGTPFSFPQ
jgi:hypothetical protein